MARGYPNRLLLESASQEASDFFNVLLHELAGDIGLALKRRIRDAAGDPKHGILKHSRAVVGDMEEKDVFTSSFDERTRFSAVKEVRETGSRRSLIVLQEIEHSEMA